jgi:hypothetical protein
MSTQKKGNEEFKLITSTLCSMVYSRLIYSFGTQVSVFLDYVLNNLFLLSKGMIDESQELDS